MGPPFENGGGYAESHVPPEAPHFASMGPPFENGGGDVYSGERRGRTTSGFNGAAVRKRRRAARTSYLGWLQLASMGPPFENGGGFAALRFKFNRSKSFNGAAVRKRRRVPTPHFSTFVISASMGPPFENGGGVSKQHAANVHVASASMGPPFENGGGVGLVPVKLTETSGFNGAAVRKRRRVA